jgi:hypothetical protein
MSRVTNQSWKKSGPYSFDTLRKAKPADDEGIFSDISINILTSAKNPNIRLKFTDAFPIQLSDLLFDSQSDPSQFAKAQVVFTFRDYDFEIVGG